MMTTPDASTPDVVAVFCEECGVLFESVDGQVMHLLAGLLSALLTAGWWAKGVELCPACTPLLDL